MSKSGSMIYAGFDVSPFCLSFSSLTGKVNQIIDHKIKLPKNDTKAFSRVSCLKTSPKGYSVITGCFDYCFRMWI